MHRVNCTLITLEVDKEKSGGLGRVSGRFRAVRALQREKLQMGDMVCLDTVKVC